MPVRLLALPRRSAGLGLIGALLGTQLMLGGAWAGSTGHEGQIVYSSAARNDPGNADLWLTSAHSNSERRLTSTPEYEGSPAWAPDGHLIAFSRHHRDANGVSLGSWLHTIDPGTGAEDLLTNAGSFTSPSWSPDGNRLVFGGHSFAGEWDAISNNLFTMPSSGGDIEQLTFGPFADADPSWSPDGGSIAFSTNRAGPGSQIWLMNADGTGQHLIETALTYAQSPDWSPDGQWLVVLGTLGDLMPPELFKLRADGTDLTQLTSSPDIAEDQPTWSPDGTLVLFDANAPHGTRGQFGNELMVVSADGGVAELFGPGVRHLVGQTFPDWTP